MSHSSLMVIRTETENLDDLLAPFNENQEVDPYWKESDGWAIDYLKREGIISDDVSQDVILSALKNEFTDEKYRYNGDVLEVKSTYPKSVEGPNGGLIKGARWDWYDVGGRWSDLLLTTNGEPVNTARKRDIDWNGMRTAAINDANETFDKFEEVTAGLQRPDPWDKFQSKFDDIDEARAQYHGNPFNQALHDNGLFPFLSDVNEYFHLNNADPRGAFAQEAADRACATFAYLKDGEWFERGQMGWFGMVSDEKDENSWAQHQAQMVDSLPDDVIITIVDVHI